MKKEFLLSLVVFFTLGMVYAGNPADARSEHEGMADASLAAYGMNAEFINENAGYEAYTFSRQSNNIRAHQGFRNRREFSVGLGPTLLLYNGDYAGGLVRPGFELAFGYWQNRTLSLRWNTGVGQVGAKNVFTAYIGYSGLDLTVRVMNNLRGTPFLRVGGGLLYHSDEASLDQLSDGDNLMLYANALVGYEWLVRERIGLSFSAGGKYLSKDNIDGMVHGNYNDLIFSVNAGATFYFNFRK
jgi:curli production assembly/transport component CsgG